jgi:DNA-binding CsgD family transcriptional regulator
MSRPKATLWNATFSAASRLAPPEDWRQDLARAIREATGAEFASVLTCPPGDWNELQAGTFPGPYGALIERINREFRPRIDEAGEDWRFAIRKHGRVYTPVETALNRPLAEDLRDSVLKPADVDGYMVAFLVDRAGAMLGLVAIGARCERGELVERAFREVDQTVRLAADTLSGALALSGACKARAVLTPAEARAAGPPQRDALVALSSREREIAALVAEGYRNVNIGAHLDIGDATVATHLRRIFKKLGVSSRVELATRWHGSRSA